MVAWVRQQHELAVVMLVLGWAAAQVRDWLMVWVWIGGRARLELSCAPEDCFMSEVDNPKSDMSDFFRVRKKQVLRTTSSDFFSSTSKKLHFLQL